MSLDVITEVLADESFGRKKREQAKESEEEGFHGEKFRFIYARCGAGFIKESGGMWFGLRAGSPHEKKNGWLLDERKSEEDALVDFRE